MNSVEARDPGFGAAESVRAGRPVRIEEVAK